MCRGEPYNDWFMILLLRMQLMKGEDQNKKPWKQLMVHDSMFELSAGHLFARIFGVSGVILQLIEGI
jgi:hypothetical protein